jgi:oxygen-independent coproporphyrinogen-3 oxidase
LSKVESTAAKAAGTAAGTSGIYIHIPFCKKACHYCNFHFSTSLKLKDALIDALCTEIALQKDYLGEVVLGSVYFGGGTPSLLAPAEINRLLAEISRFYKIAENAEITLEANPDDLTADYLDALRHETPVNRLSIGIQSFSEEDLRWMNRAHNATEARRSIELALQTGFTNLTVDLIYGSPTTSDEQWATNLQTVFDLGIPHVSSYCLTVESGTALFDFIKKQKTAAPEEEKSLRQFRHLMQQMREKDYDHYEISNFALPGHYAVHNSNYWKGVPYLGIGPAAHSYDGKSRQWNLAHNPKYIQALAEGRVPFEKEILTLEQRYNEYVMTSLRTIWGCDIERITAIDNSYRAHFEAQIQAYIVSGDVLSEQGIYRLTDQGKFLADGIAAAVFG